jgi:hypothetical protein
LVIRFAQGEIVTSPEPTDLSGAKFAQLDLYHPMQRTSRLLVWRPGEDNFEGPESG